MHPSKLTHNPNQIWYHLMPWTNLYIFITRDLVKLFSGTHRKLFTSEIIPQNGKVLRARTEYEIFEVTGQATLYSSTICVAVFRFFSRTLYYKLMGVQAVTLYSVILCNFGLQIVEDPELGRWMNFGCCGSEDTFLMSKHLNFSDS